MALTSRTLGAASTLLLAVSCAHGGQAQSDAGGGSGGGDGGGSATDASCGARCDQDGDGVPDGSDHCPNTPAGAPVNHVGCADSQLTFTLEPTFPPYNLTWTSAGSLGRPGGLTWTYTAMQRGDLFHIDWVICDDPAFPCGLSLDGPIDAPSEAWSFSAAESSLGSGKVVFDNSTHILLADGTMPALAGRLTVTIADGSASGSGSGSGSSAPITFAPVATLGVPPRMAQYGAEIPGTSYTVVALAEVQDPTTLAWTPYEDYYDAAPTPAGSGSGSGSGSDNGSGATVSFGGSFYDK